MSYDIARFGGPSNLNLSYNVTAAGPLSKGLQVIAIDPANNVGYGLGKLVRGAFDHLVQAWHRIWVSESSASETVFRKQQMIYRQGLRECFNQLDRALVNLLKNSDSPDTLKKFESLVSHYSIYLKPTEHFDLRYYQHQMLQQLEARVSRLAPPHIKNAVRQLLPMLFPEKSGAGVKEASLSQIVGAETARGKAKRSGQLGGTFPASFNLAVLDGVNGFEVTGLGPNSQLGYSVSTVGDLNGDGKADIVLGAPSGTGATYVLFGQDTGWPAHFNLATLSGLSGFSITAITNDQNLGYSVSTAGDINGDGKADLVIGVPLAFPNGLAFAGRAYVLFGKANGWPAYFDLTTLNGGNGFVVDGVVADGRLGISVSTAGDINVDGIDDLVLGAPYTSPPSNRGRAYIIFGKASGWGALFNLTTLDGTNGFTVDGLAAGVQLGACVGTTGDLNGDGKIDLVLGSPAVTSPTGFAVGAAYTLFGQASGWPAQFNLTTLNGANGFVVYGLGAQDDYLGFSVGTGGDINGDGIDELVIGDYGTSPGARIQAGAVYTLFGRLSGWPAIFDLTTLDGTNGFVVNGLAANDRLGITAGTAGDLNGDGFDDLLIGATGAAPNAIGGAGKAYVLFGHPTGWPAQFDLTILNGTNGFTVNGLATPDSLGYSVRTGGDMNGDGISDIILGAPYSSKGNAYIIFGINTSLPSPTPTPTPILTPTPTPTPTPIMSSTLMTTSSVNPTSPSSQSYSSPSLTGTNPTPITPFPTVNPVQSPISTLGVSLFPVSSSRIPTPGSINSPPSSVEGQTIGIAVGVSVGIVAVAGVASLIAVLRYKKKAKDAKKTTSTAVEPIHPYVEPVKDREPIIDTSQPAEREDEHRSSV